MTVTSSVPPAGAAVLAAPAGGARALRDVLVVAAVVVARVYIGFTATLAVVALAPALLDWNSYVVRSGSMEPDVAVGDVVVARPLAPSEAPEQAHVFVFEDPASDSGELLVHRVVERQQDGRWVTQGDANASPDVAPVPREAFRDRARVLVPLIGRPVRWWREGDVLPLAAWLVLTGAALATLVAGRSAVPRHRHKGPRNPPSDRNRDITALHRRVARPTVLTMTAVTGMAVLITGPGIASASAGFTATTRNPGNGWSMTAAPVQRYTGEVRADNPYFYYLLDEASGTTTDDASDNGRHGALSSVAGYRSAGALPNNFGYSMNLGTTGRVVSGGSGLFAPETFTLEMWFRTTTTAGGKLIGFESTQTATGSLQYDRHVTMRTDGRLVYGDWNASQMRTITSPASYNDGTWHHLALTAVPNGSQQNVVLYVDGQPVTSGTTTRTGDYTGWWRVGHGKVRNAFGLTANGGFPGQVDQVAVYRTALSAARVRAHHAAR